MVATSPVHTSIPPSTVLGRLDVEGPDPLVTDPQYRIRHLAAAVPGLDPVPYWLTSGVDYWLSHDGQGWQVRAERWPARDTWYLLWRDQLATQLHLGTETHRQVHDLDQRAVYLLRAAGPGEWEVLVS